MSPPEDQSPEEAQEARTDLEWLLVNGVRQLMTVAQRSQATYADAVSMTLDLSPTLLPAESQMVGAFKSEMERLYLARAAAQSADSAEPVSALQVLDTEIAQMTKELDAAGDRHLEILKQLERLRRTQESLATQKVTESQVIRNDSDTFGLGKRLPVSRSGADYKDYQFHRNRILRVRILHPDPAEWRTGVDLIYESYWSKRHPSASACRRSHDLARIAALQYKMWDGKRLYVSSDSRILKQLERAERAFCQERLCEPGRATRKRFGVPHCSVFLRPTDKQQRAGGFSVSHALHVPTCEVRRQLQRNPKKLEARSITSSSVSQVVFSELFNRNMLGSRWVQASQLERIYRDVGVLKPDGQVVIHAQEFGEAAAGFDDM